MSDMKAVVIREAGGPEVLNIETVPVPTPKAGWVLIVKGAAYPSRRTVPGTSNSVFWNLS
jgi:hypothetical protein